MHEQRLKGLMGLCVRAGQAVFGEDGCLKTIRAGNCAALLLDASASAQTREKYEQLCGAKGVPFLPLREDLLYEATGKPGKAMAVLRGSLGTQIADLAKASAAENDFPQA
jgi:ribosomal protein L7Ae-like RNA K-turn-binding protein